MEIFHAPNGIVKCRKIMQINHSNPSLSRLNPRRQWLLFCLVLAMVSLLNNRAMAESITARLNQSNGKFIAEKNSYLANLTERTLPAVVSILVSHGNEKMPAMPAKSPEKLTISAQGSGFIIDKSGLVVTNHHVIERAELIEIVTNNGKKYRAKLIGSDILVDIALLKIDSTSEFPVLRLGNSESVKVGDWVMAVGNPFGLEGTVTVGILSARRGYAESGSETDLLQTDAPINRGNSGGPMLNLSGKVVGINSSIFANELGESVRIGFAIPSNEAAPILAQLKKYGRVKRGNIALALQRLEPEIAARFAPNPGGTAPNGVIIARVKPQGNAAKAGLHAGDIIIQFHGRGYSDPEELARAIRHAQAGDKVKIDILRHKTKMKFTVELTELPPSETNPNLAFPPDDGLGGDDNDEGEDFDDNSDLDADI